MILNKAKALIYNGGKMVKAYLNNGIVWQFVKKILKSINDYPIKLENSTGENLVDYKIYGNQDPEAIILPDEYVRLDYIQCTGTQYIDTGYKPNGATQVEAHISDITINGVLFGAYNQDWTTGYGMYCNANRDFWYHYYSNTRINTTPPTDFIMAFDKGKTYINGTSVATTSQKTFTLNYSMYLLAGNWYNTRASQPTKCKLYYAKIYDSDTLVRDFIPCKNSDNEVGLYDLVENKFYGNSGTGDFVAGDEVVEEILKVGDKYYKAGEQLYKIPIKVSNDTETEYEIYLNKPLGKIGENADYIDFENQEVAYYDYFTGMYTKEKIELSEIETSIGTNVITVETSLKPSYINIIYWQDAETE